ncbi:hypothetical protein, conserved [Trypanosoma brucei brucei TREU927]|uniref:Uncharacterized protein n=1 Tax=Trypanosoma brucei brucei (strain 927/4 GUTat10.1) TaxID=185431 RepID=Q57UA3_TRYB2|nr:hypothetical protein, conserved [Trypanosoma brucei brucei TREU927]AAX70816.1 hypothetical protein, conserved [Trypanosoma brucei]AAZ11474.1 hypothetical protein, conserved [Trypanosoma brucei brucei TREU927]
MEKVTPTSLANAFLATAGISAPMSSSGIRGLSLRSVRETVHCATTQTTSAPPPPANCQQHQLLNTTEDKCNAIFAEVELLSKWLQHAVESRAHVEREAYALLQQADVKIQHLEDTVRQKEMELLYMRGAMESLRTRVEFYECRERRIEGDDDDANFPLRREADFKGAAVRKVVIMGENNTNDSYCSNRMGRGNGVMSPADFTVDSTEQLNAGKCVDLGTTATTCNSNGVDNASVSSPAETGVGGRSRVGHSALSWVRYLLERCVSNSGKDGASEGAASMKKKGEGNDQLADALTMLTTLQCQYADPNGDLVMMNSLCTKFSNSIVAVAEELNTALQIPLKRASNTTDSLQISQAAKVVEHPESAAEALPSSNQEPIMQCRKSVVEENLQLLQSLMAVESSSREAWSTLQKY